MVDFITIVESRSGGLEYYLITLELLMDWFGKNNIPEDYWFLGRHNETIDDWITRLCKHIDKHLKEERKRHLMFKREVRKLEKWRKKDV